MDDVVVVVVVVVVVEVLLELLCDELELLDEVVLVEFEEPLSAVSELTPGPLEELATREMVPLRAEPGPLIVGPLLVGWLSTRVGPTDGLPPLPEPPPLPPLPPPSPPPP
ncbi:MAG: hypothetical protein ACYCXW_16610 [Solirubrobacteraceae bacterium]